MPDLELRSPHPITWATQLHPQLNPSNPHWSVQNPLIRITSGSNNPPQEPDIIAQSHTSGVWSNEDLVTIDWKSDSSVAYYSYAWEQDGVFTEWQDTTQSEVTSQRGNGEHTFHLQAIGSNGQASDRVQLDAILIDLITPTVAFQPSPTIITNPLTTHISLSYLASDDGQSLVTFDIAYATAPLGSEPPPVPFDPELTGLITTSLSLSDLGLSLQANTTYYVWVRGHDEAGNLSDWLEWQVSYKPAPLLQLSPQQLFITRLYSETLPITLPLTVHNGGGGVLNWQALAPFSTTQLSQYTGVATSTVLLTVTHPITVGHYQYPITFTGPLTSYNSPYLFLIKLWVVDAIYPIYLPVLLK